MRQGRHAVVFEGSGIANLGFVVGERCVAVIDTGGSEAEGQALDCAIRGQTALPVCYVINTHVHPDHTLGNAAFDREGVIFVGHEKLPRAFALRGDTYLARASAAEARQLPASYIRFPERLVGDTVQLDLGERILSVRAQPSAHTDHDLSVVDERTATAFAGDLVFLEHIPVLDGSVNGWIAVLTDMTAEPFAYIVPGHGPVRALWPDAAGPTLGYLENLRDDTRAWIADGGDLAAAQRTIGRGETQGWRLFDRYQGRNVGTAYAELEWED